jgi:hypothetical protein
VREEKSKKKRQPVDAWYWQLVVQACDSRCCACGKHQSELKDPLERGHIKLHAEDGDAEPENILPVCRGCNKKYTKTDTPFDYLPATWRERLGGLLMLRLNPKYHVGMVVGHTNMVLTINPTENTQVIDWKTCDFGLPIDVYTWSSTHGRDDHHSLQRVVNDLLRESRKCPNTEPPYPPSKTQQATMRDLVKRYSAERFMLAGRFYLTEAPWITPDNRFLTNSWQPFIDGFEGFEEASRERVAREAAALKQRTEQRTAFDRRDRERFIEEVRAIPNLDYFHPDLLEQLNGVDLGRELPADLKVRCDELLREHRTRLAEEKKYIANFERLRKLARDCVDELQRDFPDAGNAYGYRDLLRMISSAETDEQVTKVIHVVSSIRGRLENRTDEDLVPDESEHGWEEF